MVTVAEIVRWFVYRISSAYYRFARAIMRRDKLLSGSERRFRALIEAAPDAMVIVNWHGHIALVNAQFEKIFGYPRKEILGQNVGVLVPERLRDGHREHMRGFMKAPKTRPMGQRSSELLGRRKDGSEFPIEISLSPLESTEGLLISAVIRDVTARKLDEERLRHLAHHDDLTGLYNRRSFEEHLMREIAVANRHGREGTLLLIDVDGLKDVNDTLGHAQGDELLRNVSQMISSRTRETDIVARIGGDEFALLLPATDVEGARRLANDVLVAVRENGMVLGAQRLRASACAGIAGFGVEQTTAQDVMVAADLALYEAKDQGRNRVAVHEPFAAEATLHKERAAWSQRIRDGLDEDMFIPFLQPIIRLSDRRVVRYELLARMLDERGSAVAPGAFLSAAERTGLVRELDRLMINAAIGLIQRTEEAGDEPFAFEVNISARSITDETLPAHVAELIEDARIDPSKLVFEITETTAIANMQRARTFAKSLRELGCSFALDDFGSGFASFYYLKHLPLDALKIDGDFIGELRRNPTDRLLVRHMAEIASSLGLLTIAEYVEDAETLELLDGLGIDRAQGFFVGRPGPVSQYLPVQEPEEDPGDEPAEGAAARPEPLRGGSPARDGDSSRGV